MPMFITANIKSAIVYLGFLLIHFSWNWVASLLENKGDNVFLQIWFVSLVNFVYCLVIYLKSNTKLKYD